MLFQWSAPSPVICRIMPIMTKKFKTKGDEQIREEVRGHLTSWLLVAAQGHGKMQDVDIAVWEERGKSLSKG